MNGWRKSFLEKTLNATTPNAVEGNSPADYWWTSYQMEWATDLLFQDKSTLARIYPSLVRHAVDYFKSPDVLGFLEKRVFKNGKADISHSYKQRHEGIRVKHFLNGNSIKMYDKAGKILRIETTIGNPKDFCVYRPRGEDERGEKLPRKEAQKMVWRKMRKSVADLQRCTQLSQRANERYLDSLSVVQAQTPCAHLFDALSRPIVDAGRRFRALRLGDKEELALLSAISRGEFAVAGFRNQHLRRVLFPKSNSKDSAKKQSAKVSRFLRLLRAHSLIRKIQKTSRYQLTHRGHQFITALFASRNANLEELLKKAA